MNKQAAKFAGIGIGASIFLFLLTHTGLPEPLNEVLIVVTLFVFVVTASFIASFTLCFLLWLLIQWILPKE